MLSKNFIYVDIYITSTYVGITYSYYKITSYYLTFYDMFTKPNVTKQEQIIYVLLLNI